MDIEHHEENCIEMFCEECGAEIYREEEIIDYEEETNDQSIH